MNKKKCGGFSPLIIMIGIFVLLSLGTGVYIVKRNPTTTPDPFASISPMPASTSTPTPTPTSVATTCVVGGCSGELCLPEDQGGLASICIIEPHYACYKKARCEVQQSGVCGWTETREFAACIKTSQTTPVPTPSVILCKPPVKCAVPPPGCDYRGSSTCACGKLVCPTLSPTPVVTPIFTPMSTPTPLPIATPVPTPISTPSQDPSASPIPSPITELRIEADDLGFYPAGAISFSAGTRVKLTFAVRTSNVYYGGLDFRSSKFSTVQASPGQTVTVEFTADSSFAITSYWPVSNVYKASLQVNVQ